MRLTFTIRGEQPVTMAVADGHSAPTRRTRKHNVMVDVPTT